MNVFIHSFKAVRRGSLDISKAFGEVWRDELIFKPKQNGISGPKWFLFRLCHC